MTELSDRLATLSPAKRALLEKLRAAPPIPRAPDGPAPLSAEQRRLWYVLPLAPGYPVYTIAMGFVLRGALDVDALVGALRDLVARHETLRTAFAERDGEPAQIVHDGAAWQPRIVEIPADQWAASEARYQADEFAQSTFDIAAGETFRATLLRLADDEHHLLLSWHHLVVDGFTTAMLLRELGALYAARIAGEDADLPAPPVRFRDWAAYQRRPREGADADEAYWAEALRGAPHVLDLPADHPRPAVQSWSGAKHVFSVDAELTEALDAAARAEGTTLFVLLATAYSILLARYAGQEDVLVGTLLANRPRPELANVAGFFANTVPLRMRMDGDPRLAELIRHAHDTVAAAQKHGALPFDRIVELAGVRRDFSRPPLVQALLTFTEGHSDFALPGIEVEYVELDTRTAIFDLTLQVERRADGLGAGIQYPDAVFDEETVRRMGRHLLAVLRAFAADRTIPVSRVSLADEEETATVAAWSDGGPALLDGGTIPALWKAQTRATPDAVALVHGRDEMTYAELGRRANRVAHGLIGAGVGPGDCVGICMARTPALLAAMLGVLQSGAAYVPMDPSHPALRHRAALNLSNARLVIADAASRAALGGIEDIAIRTVAELDGGRDDDPAPRATPHGLAYVIFTSGSTGGPKGVAIEHRSAAAMLAWVRELLGEEKASVLGSTPITFDVSVGELFGTLCCGGTVVLVENALAQLPPGRTVLAAPMTPTAAAELLRENRLATGVRLLLGGEAVPPPLVGSLAEAGIHHVVNLWGPTEDTTYSTSAVLEPFTDRVGIGRPIAGGRVYVLDAALRHAGIGAPGEVWTAGAGVARGYASRPGLTAEKFRPDPHGPPGARMYRTLDRGRWREDGTLEYLGRMDAQVKVRGHRIELEEVEQALASHPAVAHAGVAARGEGGAAARGLAGYLVARPDAALPTGAELRSYLRERLPEYMVPAVFTWMAALPRTTSGKLDRRALPEPDAGADGETAYVPPAPGMEERLAAVWQDVLGVERIGAHDDFFDLGGQSILAARLTAKLKVELGLDVPVAMLVQAPTVESMARALAAGERAVRLPLVPLQTFGDRPPLFMVHPAGGHVICYRGMAVQLAPHQPVYGLQPRGLEDGQEPIDSLPEMAAYYVEAIRRFRPNGPYRLGGWSFGGVVAWEMARQLRAAGEDVDLLALLDTSPLTDETIAADPRDPAEVMMQTIGGYAGWMAAERIRMDEARHLPPREMAIAMIRQVADERLLPESRADLIIALTRVRSANLAAQATYDLRPYDGHLTYFRTEASAESELLGAAHEFWGSRAGSVTVVPVTGDHGTILHEPHVTLVSNTVLALGPG
jgi:amino acid adenylation domain-containing protein